MVSVRHYLSTVGREETFSTLAANERALWGLLAAALVADTALT